MLQTKKHKFPLYISKENLCFKSIKIFVLLKRITFHSNAPISFTVYIITYFVKNVNIYILHNSKIFIKIF